MKLTIRHWQEYSFYLTHYLSENLSAFDYDFDQLPVHYQVQFFQELTSDRRQLFYQRVNPFQFSSLFSKLSPPQQLLIVSELEDHYVMQLFKACRVDDLVDLFEEVASDDKERLASLVKEKKLKKIEEFLSYAEHSIGSLMTTEFVSFPSHLRVDDSLHKIRELASHAESIYYIFTVNEAEQLTGVLSLRELLQIKDGTASLEDYTKKQLIQLQPHMHRKAALQLINSHQLLLLPVVSVTHQLIGIVTIDDLLVEEPLITDKSKEKKANKLFNFIFNSTFRTI